MKAVASDRLEGVALLVEQRMMDEKCAEFLDC